MEKLTKQLHCKNCGVLCPPNEQHTIGVISHQPLQLGFADNYSPCPGPEIATIATRELGASYVTSLGALHVIAPVNLFCLVEGYNPSSPHKTAIQCVQSPIPVPVWLCFIIHISGPAFLAACNKFTLSGGTSRSNGTGGTGPYGRDEAPITVKLIATSRKIP